MFFWTHEDRSGPDGTGIIKLMPFPWAIKTFGFLVFEEIIKTKNFPWKTAPFERAVVTG